jgi:DNA (cytosine-5)-methyltransferase 1
MSHIMPSDGAFHFEPNSTALLAEARQAFGKRELAQRLDVDRKTIARWEKAPDRLPVARQLALREILRTLPSQPKAADFTFIDLFAGIGGMRAGFQAAGGRCVFSSEWNPWAQKTYTANFGTEEPLIGDITECAAQEIPDHDVLSAGFPCQPFSIAGVSKKNALGRPHGFECTTQGTLFFDVARIIAKKRPKAFLLENVKNLLSHDKGNTFRIIRETLEKELHYTVSTRVIDGQCFVPQHRERILIVGFREDTGFSLNDLDLPEERATLGKILHPEDGTEPVEAPYTTFPDGKVHPKYILTAKLWRYLQSYAEKHRLAGNGFGFGLVDRNSVTRTLSARYYKDGSEILVKREQGKSPRRLTPRECARLMGFPDTFRIPVSDTQAYKQFGNSVIVPVIQAVALHMKPHILALKQYQETGTFQPALCLAATTRT